MRPSEQTEGSITIQYPEPLVAGELVTVRFMYEVASAGMAAGGRLRLALPNPGWAQPLVPQHYFWDCYQKGRDRRYTDYDKVNTTAAIISKSRKAAPFLTTWAGFREPFGYPKRWLKNYDRWWIEVTLEDDGLDGGDMIIVTYGDRQRKPLTARIQGFPDRKVCFVAFVDPTGTNEFQEAAGSPWMISVQSGEASRIDVIAPSVVRPSDNPQILVAYTDAVKVKPCRDPEVKSLEISGPDNEPRAVQVNDLVSSLRIDAPELAAQPEGCPIRIEVRDSQRGLAAVSNPTLARQSSPRLFWGDLHVQSQYHSWSEVDQVGISCGTPEEVYDFARDVTGLDFCAITDTNSICQDIWSTVRDIALKTNCDDRFVVFQGTELGDNVDGHRNVIFAGDRAEPGIATEDTPDKDTGLSAHRLQEIFHGRNDVLLNYHNTKMSNNRSRWDPTIEQVLEIYSAWGAGERPGTDKWEVLGEMTGGAQEAWAKGYRLGVVGGSDTHVGTPGRNIANCERDEMLIYPNGITGVWAPELTRESIFSALKARRCYGTTGVRIIVEFFLQDKPMGSEVSWHRRNKPREFRLFVCGTDELEGIQVVKNNTDVYDRRLREDFTEISWADTSIANDGDYYYIRATQHDGHCAWSSPIWIDCAPEQR